MTQAIVDEVVRRKMASGRLLRLPARILLVGAGVILGLVALGHAYSFVGDPILKTANDFTPDYVSAKALIHGVDPYSTVPNLITRYVGPNTIYYSVSPPDQINSHPPALLLFFVPFALLKLHVARAVWFILTALFIYAAVALSAKHLGMRTSSAIALAVATFALPTVQREFLFGQIDGLLLLLLVLGWISLRNGKHGLGGIFLGAASAAKLFPLFLLLPLLRMKLHKTATWLIATFTGLSTLGFLVLGPTWSLAFLKGASKDTAFWRANAENTSFFGLAFRWLTPSTYRPHAPNLLPLAWAIAIVVIGVCVYCALRTPARTSDERFLAALPWMLLAAPLSWNTALILMIPYFLVIGVSCKEKGTIPPMITMLGASMVAIGAPIRFAGSIPAKPWQYALYSLPTLGLLLMGIGEWRSPATNRKQSLLRQPGAQGVKETVHSSTSTTTFVRTSRQAAKTRPLGIAETPG